MNPTQIAPVIGWKAQEVFERAKQVLDQVSKSIKTIGVPVAALEGFSTFSGTVLESATSTDRPERNEVRDFQTAPTLHGKISSYAELEQLIHHALRIQNPEWIGPDGESEMCEFYEARFAQLLGRKKAQRQMISGTLT
jgi:hypothetical protein